MILRARVVLPVSSPAIEDGAIITANGRIEAVGRWLDLKRAHSGAMRDLGEVVVLPGLVNAHCHLDYTDMGGVLPRPRTFPDWIKGLVSLKASWGFSEYAASWLRGARMLLESGVTTVADIEAVPELLPDVWQASPLRIVTFLELINVRSWHSAGTLVRELEERALQLGTERKDGRHVVGLSPHAPYTTSPELVKLSAASARKHGWPLTTHLAESREEFDMFTRGAGTMHEWLAPQRGDAALARSSPVRYVAAAGLLGPDLIAAHVNYLAEGDARLLAANKVSVVHCPRCHDYMRHEPFPLEELSAQGVNICLGTDSLASVKRERREPLTLSLFAEMRSLAAREPGLSAEAILRMATLNGAQALGRKSEMGQLAQGGRPDLIAVPYAGSPAQAAEAVVNHRGALAASMIGGEWAIPPEDGGRIKRPN
jgi:aminodeoxyfutalosine deaminase